MPPLFHCTVSLTSHPQTLEPLPAQGAPLPLLGLFQQAMSSGLIETAVPFAAALCHSLELLEPQSFLAKQLTIWFAATLQMLQFKQSEHVPMVCKNEPNDENMPPVCCVHSL